VRAQEWGPSEAIAQSGEDDEWCSPPVAAEGTSYFYSSYLPESPVQGGEKGGGGSETAAMSPGDALRYIQECQREWSRFEAEFGF
jgi:hypothetical protein